MSKHTEIQGIVTYGTDRFEIQANNRRYAVVDTLDDAQHIVRCVNSHDALVAALEAITGMVEAHAGHPMSNDKRTKDARAALAAAKS